MSRLTVVSKSKSQNVVEGLYKDMERRITASPPGLCPVDLTAAFLKLCHAQTCGKCVPCRIGLHQAGNLLQDILDGKATMETLSLLESTARVIYNSSDCAIGYEAAELILKGLRGFREDYLEHIHHGRCTCTLTQPVPCVDLCPAEVDIPGYVALVGEGRYADAVRLIRKDNPFPVACAFICEHPCEARCRRNMIDDAVNIRGLKRAATDYAGIVSVPSCAPSTGKRVAVIGGGPSGLTAAYFLQLMGHQTMVYEQRADLGGMLRYGIPNYRLPREKLQEDIDAILSTGVEIHLNTSIGSGEGQISLVSLQKQFDAVYIAIGAHTDKKVGMEGEDAEGVISAVEMLRSAGDGNYPDLKGKKVCVVGGGNVAMDVTRSAIRLGAEKVTIVYRRRREDMTALAAEVEGAVAEGASLLELHAPVRIEKDHNNQVTALWATPKMPGPLDDQGRPGTSSSGKEEVRIPCEVILVAVGQGIDSGHFEESGIPIHGGNIQAEEWSEVTNTPGVFAGGDCVTGPATVIRAIAAGKVVAANIDQYLGFMHIITAETEVPDPNMSDRKPCGRIELAERDPGERKNDFELVECGMSNREACQEASRCLRCDHFGYGIFKGGRKTEW